MTSETLPPLMCSQGGVPYNKAHLDAARKATAEAIREGLKAVAIWRTRAEIAEAELSRLQEALAAAETERDEARRLRTEMAERFFMPLENLGVIEALEARIAAKDEALKPFARHASQFDGLDDEWFCTPAVQIKHLRAAIRSLSADEAQP